MYITIKLEDHSVRVYPTEEKAKEHCLKINKREPNHPSFYLYKAKGQTKALFLGRLYRVWGRDEYFWRK